MVSGKGARNKGLNFEREIAKQLREENIFPNAKRHLESQLSECKGFDLDHTGNLKIQLKRNKKYCSISKLQEVQTEQGDIPMLLSKGDHMEPVAVLYWKDFLRIIKDIGEVYE